MVVVLVVPFLFKSFVHAHLDQNNNYKLTGNIKQKDYNQFKNPICQKKYIT